MNGRHYRARSRALPADHARIQSHHRLDVTNRNYLLDSSDDSLRNRESSTVDITLPDDLKPAVGRRVYDAGTDLTGVLRLYRIEDRSGGRSWAATGTGAVCASSPRC